MTDRPPLEDPAYEGEGEDPWMPARIAAMAEAEESESQVYAAYWAALVLWLAYVWRRLREGRYDPTVIPGAAPQWQAAMVVFGEDTLVDVAETAYENTTGTGYPRSTLELARERARQRANMLSQFPDELYVLIQRTVDEGMARGDSIDAIAAEIDTIMNAADTPRWRNRATMVARTETLSALNGGRYDGHLATAARLGGAWERVWVATMVGPSADRTRPTHRDADGQRIPVDGTFSVGTASLRFPLDPLGPPQETIQCRCTAILVRPGQNTDFTARRA